MSELRVEGERGKDSFVKHSNILKKLGNVKIRVDSEYKTVKNYLAETSMNIQDAKNTVKALTPDKKNYPKPVRAYLDQIEEELKDSDSKTLNAEDGVYILYSESVSFNGEKFETAVKNSKKLSADLKKHVLELFKNSKGNPTKSIKFLKSPKNPNELNYKDVQKMTNLYEDLDRNTLLLMKAIIIKIKELNENLDYINNVIDEAKAQSDIQLAAESKLHVGYMLDSIINYFK